MKLNSYISSIIITFSALAIMSGCKDSEVVDNGFRTIMAKVSDVKLNKIAYWPGETVNCSFILKNETNYPMEIREVKAVIQNGIRMRQAALLRSGLLLQWMTSLWLFAEIKYIRLNMAPLTLPQNWRRI